MAPKRPAKKQCIFLNRPRCTCIKTIPSSVGRFRKPETPGGDGPKARLDRAIEDFRARLRDPEMPGPSAPRHPIESVNGVIFYPDGRCDFVVLWEGEVR